MLGITDDKITIRKNGEEIPTHILTLNKPIILKEVKIGILPQKRTIHSWTLALNVRNMDTTRKATTDIQHVEGVIQTSMEEDYSNETKRSNCQETLSYIFRKLLYTYIRFLYIYIYILWW